MELRLKVLVGQSAGQELSVPGPKFLVGRAEDCQLRPRSDLISRHHCALLVEEGFVSVRDFGSKNGTLVNSERVVGERELKNGDRLTIGPLEFEVCLRTSVASKKRPKVESVKEAAARSAATPGGDVDVDQWLKPDENIQSLSETRRLAVNETEEIDLGSTTPLMPQADAASEVPKPHDAKHPGKKRPPGKLPPVPPKTSSHDSGKAASDVLNKFFKRR
jgi:pSer/pThr/pTyr-binding forkhead associated (FHA) protein